MIILVVEENDYIRDVITVILQGEGYEVAVASNGLEAIHFLRRRNDIDLVLADVMMPFMDGWQLRLAMLARADIAAVPIVMMTGGLAPSAAGLPLLRKPFGMKELLEVVRTQCRRKEREIKQCATATLPPMRSRYREMD